MLKTKDIVVATGKGPDGKEKVATKTYDRVYLEYGPNDPIEEVQKTSKGDPVGKITRPKNDVTVHPAAELMPQALELYESDYPSAKLPDGSVDENKLWLYMLADMSYGRNLRVTAPYRTSLAPTKPIDQDKAILDAAKKQVAGGLYDSIDEAVADMRARAAKRLAERQKAAQLTAV